MISMGVYDFGKHLISSVKYVQSHENIVSKIKEKDSVAIKNAQKALVVTGNNASINQTINNITIKVSSSEGQNYDLSLDKDEIP